MSRKAASFLAKRRREIYDKIIRVDHAGELGADRIYAGQMTILGRHQKAGPVIQEMWDQEKEHLREFEILSLKHRTSKSLLSPFWSLAGWTLGASTAILGPRAAMACTVAVEKVITEHYDQQIRELIADDPTLHRDLILKLQKFRDDEQHHHDTGIQHEAELTPGYRVLTTGIEGLCRLAIKIAEKI